jgi:hypothetical protein
VAKAMTAQMTIPMPMKASGAAVRR